MLTSLQNDMLKQMNEYRATKVEQYHVLPSNRLPDYHDLPPAILGTFSMHVQETRSIYILTEHSVQSNLTWFTAGWMARDYLKLHYPKYKPKATYNQVIRCVQDKGIVPKYARPFIGDATYLDLNAAFWNITRAVGWDVIYCPERYLCCNPENEDFPFAEHKLGRNMLVTTGQPHTLSLWDGQRVVQQKKFNPYQNLVLWRLVTDTLNAIAEEMINAGAVYVNNDGYIVPYESLPRAFDVLDSWGIPYKIRFDGRCTVRSANCYAFPNHEYKRLTSFAEHDIQQRVNIKWLKPKMQKRFSNLPQLSVNPLIW